MARIYQRGKTWYVDYAVHGERVRIAVGTSKKLAETILKEKEAELLRSEHQIAKPVDLGIDELVEKYLDYIKVNRKPHTYKRYRSIMEHVAEFLALQPGIVKMSDVERSHIEAYKSWRLSQINIEGRTGTVHRNTINLELDTIRAMFNYAAKFYRLRSNPATEIERFKVVKEKPTVLTEEDVSAILRESRGIYWTLFLTALYTGMRKGELRNLLWENLDFENHLVHIRPHGTWIPKTWEVRKIPMHPALQKALKKLPRRGPWVFTSQTGKQISHMRLTFVRACRRAGITGVTFHTLRHTFASHLLTKKGVDVVTVSKLLGHRNIETTMIYLHTDLETMREGIQRLNFTTWKVIGTNPAQTRKRSTVSASILKKKSGCGGEGGIRTHVPPKAVT